LDEQKIKEIEEKIADLEKRWPKHSVKPGMWRELEELEEELERAREGAAGEADAGQPCL
jgi:hypothetical protein